MRFQWQIEVMDRQARLGFVAIFLTYGLNLLQPAQSGPIDASGGEGREGVGANGGSYDAIGPYAKIRLQPNDKLEARHWTFRMLENRALQFPDYSPPVQSTSNSQNISPDQIWPRADDPKRYLRDWYETFNEELINYFEPTVRGGATAKVIIGHGGVKNISFYDYSYQIPFERDESQVPPKAIPEPGHREAFEKSVTAAVNYAVAKTSHYIPAKVKKVEVKFVIAGDPLGADGWWRNDLLGDFGLEN